MEKAILIQRAHHFETGTQRQGEKDQSHPGERQTWLTCLASEIILSC